VFYERYDYAITEEGVSKATIFKTVFKETVDYPLMNIINFTEIKNVIAKAMQFFREVRIEIKKISWPLRNETIASTSIVIIIVLIISLFLGIVDVGLSRVIKIILS
jgi:preprotein translocase SecE subunit